MIIHNFSKINKMPINANVIILDEGTVCLAHKGVLQ